MCTTPPSPDDLLLALYQIRCSAKPALPSDQRAQEILEECVPLPIEELARYFERTDRKALQHELVGAVALLLTREQLRTDITASAEGYLGGLRFTQDGLRRARQLDAGAPSAPE